MASPFERLAPELRGVIAAAAQSNRNAVALHLASKALYTAAPDNPAFLARLAKALEYIRWDSDHVRVSLESSHPIDAYDILFYNGWRDRRLEWRKPRPEPTWKRVLPWKHPEPPVEGSGYRQHGFQIKRRRDRTWEWKTLPEVEAVVNMFRPISGRIQTLWIHDDYRESPALYQGPAYQAPRFEPRNPLLFGECDAPERVRRCLAAMEWSASACLMSRCKDDDEGYSPCRVSRDERGTFDFRWLLAWPADGLSRGLSAAEVIDRIRDPLDMRFNPGGGRFFRLNYNGPDWTVSHDYLLS